MDELPSNWLGFLLAEGEAAVSHATLGSSVIKLLVVLLLVAANGFFVAAEFALVGVRSSRIETLAAAGSRSAKRLLNLLQNLNSYLSASQLGITLASLALGWIGEPAIARLLEGPLSGLSDTWRHSIAFVVGFSIITSLHIVLGEQAPQRAQVLYRWPSSLTMIRQSWKVSRHLIGFVMAVAIGIPIGLATASSPRAASLISMRRLRSVRSTSAPAAGPPPPGTRSGPAR